MFASAASIFSNPWNADVLSAAGKARQDGEKGWISRIVQTFQVGVWPWFGTSEDGMDDMMPWGRGTLTTRATEGEAGSSGGAGPEPGGSREVPFYHLPVLLAEVLEILQPAPGKLIFDGTLGGGGHTEALLQKGARVVAMDQDDEALRHASERLKGYADRFCALKGNFRDFPTVLGEAGVIGLDGMLIDIGVSSRHLDAAERGFSFNKDGPLDMRMDTSGPITAADIVNTYDQGALEQILWKYGEEPQARKIVKAILAERVKAPIKTTLQLADLISKVCPKYSKKHPATLTFQALRIETNQELAALEDFLAAAPKWLKPGGRLAVISFHSLEDRVVKHTLQHQSQVWLDRPEWPAPRPNPDCVYRLLSRKPLEATENELSLNPRARSARLRGVERLPQ
ncbi:16S rRNA (cytosine(1402)-N(4))-methyltransferase RsmH [Prosthecobacter dejongeii]|uniref:Ribosomal RNA small subunit methyltransferase H n=1 Tax=Prosthecobacter dejongeii TaxID=48465 RepID=A0A7W8DPM2_9BACT|nr:16S rRNA (cytosine(1402)-N(4))-methyltransferase RsmH [Prosthecobacter dejongeii]MBB5037071.1 16S rRNA (cytosine1402-N4)-methyltransferase [Prosthecobacter dejongeii]